MKPVNYHKSFEYDASALKFSGIWLEATKKQPLWHRIYSIVILGLFIYPINFLTLVEWYFSINDVKMFASMSHLVMECYMAQFKAMVMIRQKLECDRLITMMNDDYFQPRNPDEMNIVLKVLNQYGVLKRYTSFIGMGAVFLIIVFPVYIGSNLTPIRTWYPFDIHLTPLLFKIVFVHQSIAVWTIGIVNVFGEFVITGFLNFTGLQFDLLSFRIEHMTKYTGDELKEIVLNHRRILE
ncbi:uncharacterized protein LOC143198303 [Rhynchophorus ferrugineus]|uniref:uncharacterized protein LOC143198303 n=1 Tax=Rhynchophorus ferrugineus TaxID=354439 RepID=UPI003FCE1180